MPIILKNIERYKENSVITHNSFRYDVDKKLFNLQKKLEVFSTKIRQIKIIIYFEHYFAEFSARH